MSDITNSLKCFYPANFKWLINGRSIVDEVFFLYNYENYDNFHINSIYAVNIEKMIKECEIEDGREYSLKSLIYGDLKKPRLDKNIKIDREKLISLLNDAGYVDSLLL